MAFITEGLFSVGLNNYNGRIDHSLQHIILFLAFIPDCSHLVAEDFILCSSRVSGDQNTCVRERPSQ